MIREQIFVNSTKPKPSLIQPIQNRSDSPKPNGGFWTSPLLESGVSAFEQYENGALIQDDYKAWKITPKKNCSIKKIKNIEQLSELPCTKEERLYSMRTYIDFEKFFSNGYDGLYITGDVAHRNSFSNEYNLRSWDFDSILWSNLRWIDTIERIKNPNERL